MGILGSLSWWKMEFNIDLGIALEHDAATTMFDC